MSVKGGLIHLGLDPDRMTRIKHITIPAASVLLLRATPYTLVAAPGSGKLIQFVHGILEIVPGSVAYTESTDNLAIKYTDGSGVAVSQTIEMTSFITRTARGFTSIQQAVDGIVASTASLNQKLVLHNTGDGEFGNAGTGVLKVHLAYRIWTL